MEEVGLWFGPAVLDVAEIDPVAHLDEIEQKTLSSSLLAWASLMKGGQSPEVTARWRALAEAEPDERRRKTLADAVLLFAQLTDSEGIWEKGVEGMIIQESNFGRAIREKARIEIRREDTLTALNERFPGHVPASVASRIAAETDLATLTRWHKLAITAPSIEAFERECE